MKRKGTLCLLVLLLLLAGSIFISSHSRSSSPTAEVLHNRSVRSFLSAHSLTLPMMEENAPRLLEASSITLSHPNFSSPTPQNWGKSNLLIYHLISAGSLQPLFSINQNTLLLPLIARALGLSSLMLRE